MDAYIYQGELLCEDCARCALKALGFKRNETPMADTDSDDYPQGPYCDGGGEADCPQHCGDCGVFLENPLTEDGWHYVVDALIQSPATENGAHQEWAAYYDIPTQGGLWDRGDILEGWYHALKDCHGGQWSKAYARLCKLMQYYTPSRLRAAGLHGLTVETLSQEIEP